MVIDMYAISGADPEPFITINPEAVEHSGSAFGKNTRSTQPFPSINNVENTDVLRTIGIVACAGIGDIELIAITRKCQSIGLGEVVGNAINSAGDWINPINLAAIDFTIRLVAFVFRKKP